ncbi:MAG: hypothetical protein H6631_10560 [Anaerolineaceae bacterium]|nr:hypothetical protein [Anaerolineaceae bacterium]
MDNLVIRLLTVMEEPIGGEIEFERGILLRQVIDRSGCILPRTGTIRHMTKGQNHLTAQAG